MITARFRLVLCALGAVVIAAALSAGAVTKRIIAFQLLRTTLNDVDVSDGIQREEADLIAGQYSLFLLGPLGACSGTSTPVLVDGAWKAEILFGFGGEPTGHWISVDPIRGGASTPGEHRYRSFSSFRRAALAGALLRGD